MNPSPKEILDTLLGYLGFVVEIEEVDRNGTLLLQLHTADSEPLIGPDGKTMEELQFLLNRLLQIADHDAPRVQVDVEHFREMREDHFIRQVHVVAEGVRDSGASAQLDPLNSYQRRMVHNAFKDDPDLVTTSPHDDARLKRITISRR